MPRASFDQLSAFVAVAEQGSFSKAARALNKDRSTLHRQVSELEIDWGIELFERSGKFPKLTEQGASLVRPSKFIIYQMNALESATDSLFLGEQTSLSICHDASIPSSAVKQIDWEIRQRHPMTTINWLSRSRDTALNHLIDGRADFSITLNQGAVHPETGVSFINLGYPAFDYYVHRNSPLAKSKGLSLAEVQLHRQFVLEDLQQSKFGQQTLISSKISSISDPSMLLDLLETEGFSLLPKHLLGVREDEFVSLDVEFAVQSGHFGYVLLYPASAIIKPLQQDCIEAVSKWFKQVCAPKKAS
ncbi:LysR family transcriptional regulator [Vibrio maritimus]|uniref:LysR family transcriptional regulator n=1 Tax=Vibrio maritimus TaxID=990268 RepID=UPI003734CB9C